MIINLTTGYDAAKVFAGLTHVIRHLTLILILTLTLIHVIRHLILILILTLTLTLIHVIRHLTLILTLTLTLIHVIRHGCWKAQEAASEAMERIIVPGVFPDPELQEYAVNAYP